MYKTARYLANVFDCHFLFCATAICLLSFSGSLAWSQDFPVKPVRVIIPYAPGGPVDITGRILAQRLTEQWAQPVVVDNRPGAGGMIGTEFVSKAVPDGYTLLMGTLNEFAINPAVFSRVPYDPVKSFSPISLITRNPMVIAAADKVTFNSLKELIIQAKAKPGEMTWASAGNGSMNHVTGEWLAVDAGLKLLHVPYKGGAAAGNAILTGEVSFGVVALVQALGPSKSGAMKIFAVTTEKRSPLAPELPTVAELGLNGFDAAVRSAVFAPAGTPRDRVQKISGDLYRILQSVDIREKFAAMGVEAVGTSPEELEAAIAKEAKTIAKVVSQAKIKVQ